ncbi:thiamine pyrophosphate-binding protein [Georgenia ruanii]|uniref:thiamine pyrophosphate-binding protein n=1 Tax=Georgenia ruanii TaxID=348442 RepID=UPI002220930C|nr:thiamine pyrophosphate-binding protein [Georgenia ruanii]
MIAQALRDHGITDVFGVMGDANLYMMDSFQRHAGCHFYSVSHESGAVLAANGYARATGGVGVASVTHGPAFTNIVTALVEGVRERTPILVVAGDTAVVDKDNFQNISQRDVTIPTGAGFEQVRSVKTVCEDVAVAVHRALNERRPVVLNVPVDFQWQEAKYAPPAGPRWSGHQQLAPSQAALEDALGIIASARRPVVLAGRGASSEESRAALVRLADRIGAPLATTLRARDLFRGEPHNLGICGTLSHEVALQALTDADCLITFGAGLNRWTTAEGSILADKAVVQVDSESAALGRFQVVDAMVQGDAGAVADLIGDLLDEAEVKPTGYASPELAAKLAARSDADFTDASTDRTVDHRSAILKLDAAFPQDRTLVFDGGRFVMKCFSMFHVSHPSDYHHTVNFGSIGLGMGTAIGAATGSGKPTLLITGDGGFMLGGLAEFNTAVRHKLDLVVVMFNDGAYGAEHIQFRNKDMDPTSSTFDWPEFAPVADALGGKGYTVRNLAELDAVIAELPARDRPVLIDIKLDPDKVTAH